MLETKRKGSKIVFRCCSTGSICLTKLVVYVVDSFLQSPSSDSKGWRTSYSISNANEQNHKLRDFLSNTLFFPKSSLPQFLTGRTFQFDRFENFCYQLFKLSASIVFATPRFLRLLTSPTVQRKEISHDSSEHFFLFYKSDIFEALTSSVGDVVLCHVTVPTRWLH